jgi:pimeloyl-ACP methyl ester carboxylesterase
MAMANLARLTGGAAVLGGVAAAVRYRVARAERAHPAPGRFLAVQGVRLHYTELGDGPPLVMLHGLGSMVEELVLSGLVHDAAQRYRVIAFDRPGYGHSERPRRFRYGPFAQARLLAEACRMLGAERPIVFAHSWGTLVAIAWALQAPAQVRNLVLASGLYFPSVRLDAPFLVPPALPLVGGLMARTLSPLMGRALWPAWLRLLFAPAPVPQRFTVDFPTWLALRPAQLQATAEDVAATLPTLLRLAPRYGELELPAVLLAGWSDRFVSPRAHTLRLHRALPVSRIMLSRGSGHMVTHTDTPLTLSALDAAADMAP